MKIKGGKGIMSGFVSIALTIEFPILFVIRVLPFPKGFDLF